MRQQQQQDASFQYVEVSHAQEKYIRERLPSQLTANGHVDLTDAKLAEKKHREKKVKKSLIRWLVFILFMAWSRLFLFNFVPVNNPDIQATPQTYIKDFQRQAYIIGWLLFGNLADNAFDPKLIIVGCSAFIGFYYIMLGGYIYMADED